MSAARSCEGPVLIGRHLGRAALLFSSLVFSCLLLSFSLDEDTIRTKEGGGRLAGGLAGEASAARAREGQQASEVREGWLLLPQSQRVVITSYSIPRFVLRLDWLLDRRLQLQPSTFELPASRPLRTPHHTTRQPCRQQQQAKPRRQNQSSISQSKVSFRSLTVSPCRTAKKKKKNALC